MNAMMPPAIVEPVMHVEPAYKRVSIDGLMTGLDHLMDSLHYGHATGNLQHVKNYANTARIWLDELSSRMDERIEGSSLHDIDPE